jgi:nanoRNase/pAp phosphatase (c-di-AMP/oligoRNAs hydrolase)
VKWAEFIRRQVIGMDKKYRLVTRSDFDGLVCAVLLKELNLINEIQFVHPKDMQDGKIDITENDITTNLPYVHGVYLAFDHHLSESLRVGKHDNHIIHPEAPSAARVVYKYYKDIFGEETFRNISDEMMESVDKADSAQFAKEEVLNPQGWVLLNFLMDARTGLGRFRQFRISNYALMMDLIRYCKDHTIEEILRLPDVKERVELYFEQEPLLREQIKKNATVHDNLVIVNFKDDEVIHAGNRFLKYALFPQCNISIRIMWGFRKQNTVFAVGKSIFDKSSKTNVGELMLKYDGGGHTAAGTCQINHDKADTVLKELIEKINTDG